MKKRYRQFTSTSTAAVVFLLIFHSSLFSQHTLEGVVRIKVDHQLATQLEARTFTKNRSGEVVTGVPSLDQLNRQLQVRRFTRVFPHAGKNEAKHRKHGLHLWYEVSIDKSIPVSQMIQSYRSDKQILRVEPVYEKAMIGAGNKAFGPVITNKPFASTLPEASNDPLLASQWNYHNTGQTGGTPGADIGLFDAWKIETGTKDVIIAITDGGLQTDHPDLADNLWINADEIPGNELDDDNNGYIDDIHGFGFVNGSGEILPDNHGTHVAGTIAAVNNNGTGVAGIAGGSGDGDGVRLMSCAVFSEGQSDGFAQAYVYSADNGAVISQNSWGYTTPGVFEQVVIDAIDYFIAEAGKDAMGNQTGPMNGGLVIFSAGNASAEGDYYPAFYEPVLAVTSTTHKDIRAEYSNYGSWIDIAAPGGETYETDEQGVISTLAGSQYGSFMGTSMACPHVSGVAALMLSKFGRTGLHPETLRLKLLQSVDDITGLNPSFAGKLGSGRLNAARALREDDGVPPQPVNNLAVSDNQVGAITLTWTSPDDPGDVVAKYDLRYSSEPITEANFKEATAATNPPTPRTPGSAESFTLENLPGGVLFYFAVRSLDFSGNVSPLSNVVKEMSSYTPSVVLSRSALNESLQTAAHSTHSFTIANKGKGPLKFNVREPEQENPFAAVTPTEGVVLPGQTQTMTVSFDAAGLLPGTYQQDIVIESNDPERNVLTFALTLQVTDNGAPIASVSQEKIDFKSSQIGTTAKRNIKVANAGAHPLSITDITSATKAFYSPAPTPITVEPFGEAEVPIHFSPSATGPLAGVISFHTNDPAHAVIKIAVQGEGLQESPVVASPGSFNETLARGTKSVRTLVLQNNGSQDRQFRLEVVNTQAVISTDAANARTARSGRVAAQDDSLILRQQRMREQHRAKVESMSDEKKALLQVVGTGAMPQVRGTAQGREGQSALPQTAYTTGFEDFPPGPLVNDGWSATHGWAVADGNADRGSRHLRGTSAASGTEDNVALSPFLPGYEEVFYPHYTTTTMRLNLDNASGASWEIVPQDPWSYIATRIRFNANGTIEAMVIDDDYNFHWKKLSARIPSGYFDLAIEYNNWGTDTSGFPTYDLFLNNQKIFSGTGLAAGIGQVAFISPMETTGPTMDIDEFKLIADAYTPVFLKPQPMEGILAAGQSAHVDVQFDATAMKFGSYEADLVVHFDGADSLLVPAALTVTGEASIIRDLYGIYMELGKGETGVRQMTLTNTGGSPVSFNLALESPLEGLTFKPATGTLAVNAEQTITFEFQASPGLYENKIILKTDIAGSAPEEIPIDITVFETEAIFATADEAEFAITAGETSTRVIRVRNDGANTVTYKAETPEDQPWISVDPQKATLIDPSLDITFTFDARGQNPGIVKSIVTFRTNDINHPTHTLYLTLNIAADSVSTKAIAWEQWTGISGTAISNIPVTTKPTSTTLLTSFQSPLNSADNYASRVRAFIQPPVDGYYTFFIASNDNSALWLSTDDREVNKKQIASVAGYTSPLQWDKFPSQRSAKIYLERNRKYYIEALHKEGVGSDHLAVGWQLPDGTLERPVPGMRLLPFDASDNAAPLVRITTPDNGATLASDATVSISAEASDVDGSVAKVAFINGSKTLAEDTTLPYSFDWNPAMTGTYLITAVATDNEGLTTTSQAIQISVEAAMCSASGTITREYWTGISGSSIADIPVNDAPDGIETRTAFEGPVNVGSQYGARMRGYICPPATGEYFFWIASNDHSELWLSTDEDPLNKVRIAFVSGATAVKEWSKFATQRSVAITLSRGKTYYIEALHKQGVGSDHLAVGWQLPDGTLERPIAGSRLSPFIAEDSFNDAYKSQVQYYTENPQTDNISISVYPNPVKGEKLSVKIENLAFTSEMEKEVSIRQMTGNAVYSKRETCSEDCSTEIDIRDYDPGVYILQVRIGARTFTEKLIVP